MICRIANRILKYNNVLMCYIIDSIYIFFRFALLRLYVCENICACVPFMLLAYASV